MCAPWADTQVRPYGGLVGMRRGGALTARTSPGPPLNFHSPASLPPQEEPPPAVQP